MDLVQEISKQAKPKIKEVLWSSKWNEIWLESCLEEVLSKVLNIVKEEPTDIDELTKITSQVLEDILSKNFIDNLWLWNIEYDEWSTSKINEQEIKNEVSNTIATIQIMAIRKGVTALSIFNSQKSKIKKIRVAKFILEDIWIKSPIDFFADDFQEKIKINLPIFWDFKWLYKSITQESYSDEISNIEMLKFIDNLKYNNSTVVSLLRQVRKAGISYKEDLELIWYIDFSNKDFYKGITGFEIIEMVLWREIKALTQEIYLEFVNLISFYSKNDIEIHKNRNSNLNYHNKGYRQGYLKYWYLVNKSRKVRELEKYDSMPKEELKKVVLDILNKQWFNNVLDLLLLRRDSSYMYWNFEPFTSFLSIYKKLKWYVWTVYFNVENIKDFSTEYLWWDSLEQEISRLLLKENIKSIDDVDVFFWTQIYTNTYPINLKHNLSFTVRDLLNLYFNENDSYSLNKEKIHNFLEIAWRNDLIKVFDIKDDYKFIKRPEEYATLERKQLYRKIRAIIKKNNYVTWKDFLSMNNKKIKWDFSPFKSFNDMMSVVLQNRVSYPFWRNFRIFYEFLDALWLKKLKKEIQLWKKNKKSQLY